MGGGGGGGGESEAPRADETADTAETPRPEAAGDAEDDACRADEGALPEPAPAAARAREREVLPLPSRALPSAPPRPPPGPPGPPGLRPRRADGRAPLPNAGGCSSSPCRRDRSHVRMESVRGTMKPAFSSDASSPSNATSPSPACPWLNPRPCPGGAGSNPIARSPAIAGPATCSHPPIALTLRRRDASRAASASTRSTSPSSAASRADAETSRCATAASRARTARTAAEIRPWRRDSSATEAVSRASASKPFPCPLPGVASLPGVRGGSADGSVSASPAPPACALPAILSSSASSAAAAAAAAAVDSVFAPAVDRLRALRDDDSAGGGAASNRGGGDVSTDAAAEAAAALRALRALPNCAPPTAPAAPCAALSVSMAAKSASRPRPAVRVRASGRAPLPGCGARPPRHLHGSPAAAVCRQAPPCGDGALLQGSRAPLRGRPGRARPRLLLWPWRRPLHCCYCCCVQLLLMQMMRLHWRGWARPGPNRQQQRPHLRLQRELKAAARRRLDLCFQHSHCCCDGPHCRRRQTKVAACLDEKQRQHHDRQPTRPLPHEQLLLSNWAEIRRTRKRDCLLQLSSLHRHRLSWIQGHKQALFRANYL